VLHSVDRTISLIAPAKINLALHVTGRRTDGYHLLDSLVVFAAFGDRLSVRRADRDSFEMSGPYARDLPGDGSNLVLKARDILRRRFPAQAFPVAIILEKQLPIASGIGGGSSDAAATLRGLTVLWGIQATLGELCSLGLALGADIPMCLHGAPLIARGIGEEIEPIAAFPHLPMVLVNNGMEISTPQVFAALTKRDNPALPAFAAPMTVADVCTYLQQTDNHLFAPATTIVPAIEDAMHGLRATAPRIARMSGSGATCFAIYDSDEAAISAASSLRNSHPSWFVAATHSVKKEADYAQ
jgi:4-diphosphocytidyl-2-C-methyl-D-erythritol kinase